jgi:hypothetical protein
MVGQQVQDSEGTLHLQPPVEDFLSLPSMLVSPVVAQPESRMAATIINDNALMYFIFFDSFIQGKMTVRSEKPEHLRYPFQIMGKCLFRNWRITGIDTRISASIDRPAGGAHRQWRFSSGSKKGSRDAATVKERENSSVRRLGCPGETCGHIYIHISGNLFILIIICLKQIQDIFSFFSGIFPNVGFAAYPVERWRCCNLYPSGNSGWILAGFRVGNEGFFIVARESRLWPDPPRKKAAR